MSSAYLFYGDLNCPFCYAQNERLRELGVEFTVEWRGVRHAPTLKIPPAPLSHTEHEAIVYEVKRVREREPGLRISTPILRPNSEPATLLLAAATRADPRQAVVFRTLLYRALWVYGRDISEARVLDELRREAALPELEVTSMVRLVADAWQREWETGAFDRSIPALQSPRGGRLLGLSERRRVEAFLKSGIISSESADDECRSSERSP